MHTHKWIRDKTRKHGRPPRFFVICEDCQEKAQAVIAGGYLKVFTTSISRGGKSRMHMVRLSPEYEEKLQRSGRTVAFLVREKLDTM